MPSPNTIPPTPPASIPVIASGPSAGEVRTVRPLCWGAVLAGAVAALSIHLLVTLFGAGLGLQIWEPATAAEPVQKLSVGVGIAWSVAALIALWVGGWISGRLTPEANRGLGGVHGFLVWSVATVTVAVAFTGGASMLVGGIARIAGKTIGATAQVAGAGAKAGGDAVAQFAAQNSNLLESYVRELVPVPQGATAPDPRALREVSWALIRYFSRDERGGEARAELVRSIAQNTRMDEAEVNRRVDAMAASYDQVQRDMAEMRDRAEAKARRVADAAADYVTQTAVWTFVAFVIGAISASWGGAAGARSRQEHDVGGAAGALPSDHGHHLGTPRHA